MPSSSPDQASLLRGVTWDEYVRYRDDPANHGSRMTYDRGVLEIMTLSYAHELISLLIHNFITLWSLHRASEVQPAGSMTLRSQLLEQGLEGDQSYYIQHASQVLSQSAIDPRGSKAVEVVLCYGSNSRLVNCQSTHHPSSGEYHRAQNRFPRLSLVSRSN